jgi:hypothetical protein
MLSLKRINLLLDNQNAFFGEGILLKLNYLRSLPEPVNLIQRSYLQYKSQQHSATLRAKVLKQTLSLLVILPIACYYYLHCFFRKLYKNEELSKPEKVAVFVYAGIKNIIPKSLADKYTSKWQFNFGSSFWLNNQDIRYLIKTIHLKSFSPYFLLKIVYKIAMYRSILDQYNPDAIITSSEYSFTSSILTDYCKRHNVKHINIMHGEKMLNIRDSFFSFHACYVWDQHYVDLFKELRAEPGQFIIEVPESFYPSNQDKKHDEQYELTYYLAGEASNELDKIKDALIKIGFDPNKLCIRPHPRYSDIKLVRKKFQGFIIEEPGSIHIEQSIQQTKRMASLYSTVLYQGYLAGKEVVIDDLSCPDKYSSLAKLKYIMLSKPHILLSDLQNK